MNSWFIGITNTKEDRPATDEESATAAKALGVVLISREDDGCWLAELPRSMEVEIANEDYSERTHGDIKITVET